MWPPNWGFWGAAPTALHYPIICKISAPPIVKKANEPIVLYRDKSKLDIDLFNFDLSVALQEYFSSLSAISIKNYNSIFNGFVQVVSCKNKSSNNPSNSNNCSYKSQLQEKPENFNNFCCSIGKDLAQKISTLSSNRFKSSLKNRVSSSIFLEPPNISEIVALMQTLDVKKAVRHDNIPAFFIKVSKFVIAPYLNILIDFAFCNGIFHGSCKTTKVIPILESGNVNDLNNYRLISILTCLSRIFKKPLHKRLSKFLNKNNLG